MTAQRSFPSFSVLWMLSALKALFAAGLMAFLPFLTMAADKFETFVDQARGQSVYFNAWGGSPAINAYIAWAAEQRPLTADVPQIEQTDVSIVIHDDVIAEKEDVLASIDDDKVLIWDARSPEEYAGTKVVAGASQQNTGNGIILRCSQKRIANSLPHRVVDGVTLFRAIECYDEYSVAIIGKQNVAHGLTSL